ncbi:MAG: hypothetical protein ABI231_02120 [Candidatus Tumulicola sp.]
MDKLSRLAGILVCAAMVASAGCSTSNSGVTPSTGSPMAAQSHQTGLGAGWITQDGVTYHVPHYMVTRNMASQGVKPDILLNYGGGAVLTKPKMYIVFWGFKAAGDPNKVKALIIAYAKHIGGSAYNNIYTQYTGPMGHITNPLGQYAGSWTDNVNAIPLHPSDAQVAAEAVAATVHFHYNANVSYVIATAHGHSSSGFGTQYCAYHGATTTGGKVVSYTNLPYMPDAGSNCGANFVSPPSDETGADEGVTIVEGHEYGESVTDPNPPSGWYNNQQGEIGDICAWQSIQNDPYGSNSYTAQPEFSNASQSCVHQYP